tara:strand:+ start:418 stop:705 length:288 start_codon:yes stop_codon:yes gene_type:complete
MVDKKQIKQIRKQKIKQIHRAMGLLKVPHPYLVPYKLNLKTMGFRIDFDRLRYFTDHLDNYPLHRQKGWYYKKWELSGYPGKEISDEAARDLITR